MLRLSPVASYSQVFNQAITLCYTDTYDTRKDLLQAISGARCFGLSTVQAVFKLKQRLSDRIGKGYTRRVHESDLTDTPSLQYERRQ